MSESHSFRLRDRFRINRGEFEDYEVEVIGINDSQRVVQASIVFFDRPVPLAFSFAEAAGLLDRVEAVKRY